MTDLNGRNDAPTGEAGSVAEAVADKGRDNTGVPVVELHQLGRRSRDGVKAAEPKAADHLKLVE